MPKPPIETELDFLPPRAAAIMRAEQVNSHYAQKAILLLFVLFIIWSYFAELREVTRGTGKIVTFNHIQTINNLEGGIVKEVLVSEDQIVEKGQILARMDTTMPAAKYAQDTENYYRYLATEERLKAQISNQNFIPSQDLIQYAAGIVAQETQRFKANMAKKQNEFAIASQEVAVKQGEITEAQAKLAGIKEQYALSLEQLNLTQPLADKKIYPRLDFMRIQRDLIDQKLQMDLLTSGVNRQNAALRQAQEKLNQVRIRYQNDDLLELRDIESRLIEAREAQIIDSNRMMRSEIVAPLKGIVREVKVHTKGLVIQPGEVIMDIVPLDDTLLAEIQLSPADIGSINVGMIATLKLTAYDFSTYGGMEAEITEISPDTVQDKRDQNSFRVILRTKTNIIIKNGKAYPVKPGMQLEADILTGQKSVLKYMMKPFLKALQNSMTEK